MMGGLWVLIVKVVCRVVHADCVCAAYPCYFVRLTCISAPKRIAGKLLMRRAKLSHLIKANL
jgi:hypothetical protein